MQSQEQPGAVDAAPVAIPEPLNAASDLAGHAYALAHGATIMTAWAGDDPSPRQRRDIKRTLRAPGYDEMVKHLLDPDVRTIFHHQRGSVIYLNRPERINDDGDRLTAYHMSTPAPQEQLWPSLAHATGQASCSVVRTISSSRQ